MELPSVSSLEFDQVRASIKNFIKSKTDFQDYDFEGSNLSMLIDILSYNTLYTSYNINMAANELNLDTAVIRDNIVSHAKKLGYTPNSYSSAKVYANIQVTLTNTQLEDALEVILESGNILTSVQDGKKYNFILRKNKSKIPTSNITTFENIELIEGDEFEINYVVNELNENQRFIIPNNFIDSDTIEVYIKDDPTSTNSTQYQRVFSIVGINPSDKVFFVEEIQDQQYEVIFGDDVIGRKVRNGEFINIRYIITNGSKSNNIRTFTNISTATVKTKTNVEFPVSRTNINFTILNEKSDNGSEFESIKSIKYRAPRYYAAQDRAVTTSDYESIISKIYSNIDFVKVTGGETITPPQYGKVFISIKPLIGKTISDFEKIRIIQEFKKYTISAIQPEILDPKSFNIHIQPIVTFDNTRSVKTYQEIYSLIQQRIIEYTTTDQIKKFNGEYSSAKLIKTIQEIDNSIRSIFISTFYSKQVRLYKNIDYKYVLNFVSSGKDNSGSNLLGTPQFNNATILNFGNPKPLKSKLQQKYSLISTEFNIAGINEKVFLYTFSESGSKSELETCDKDNTIYLSNVSKTFSRPVGKLNFDTSEIVFNLISSIDDEINIYVIPENPDIVVPSDTYPEIIIENISLLSNDSTQLALEPIIPVPVTQSTTTSGPLLSLTIDNFNQLT